MDRKKVGLRLRELRKFRTLEEVGGKVGITKSALSSYERGTRMPKDSIKEKLAAFYGVPITIFFDP